MQIIEIILYIILCLVALVFAFLLLGAFTACILSSQISQEEERWRGRGWDRE